MNDKENINFLPTINILAIITWLIDSFLSGGKFLCVG